MPIEPCPECGAGGNCSTCEGKGMMSSEDLSLSGPSEAAARCLACGGSGECQKCGGTGEIEVGGEGG